MAKYPATNSFNEKGFAPPLSPGDYTITLADVSDVDKNGNELKDKNGFPYELFSFDVDGYPENMLFERFCFDENNPNYNLQMGRFKQFIVAIGGNPNEGGKTSDLIAKTCKAYVKVKEYQGKTYNNIAEFKPFDGNVNKDDEMPY